jgi:hypothetical protein
MLGAKNKTHQLEAGTLPAMEQHAERAAMRGRRALFLTVLAACALLAAGCFPRANVLPQLLPDNTNTPEPTYTLPATWPPTWTPTAIPTLTFTPTPWPTFTSVWDTPGPVPQGTRAPVSGSLSIDFRRNDIWCPNSGSYIAEFTIWAKGGDGQYTYYRDIDKIAGPTSGAVTYQVHWRECGGAPGTFFVYSAGMKASKEFWIDAPDCCEKQ